MTRRRGARIIVGMEIRNRTTWYVITIGDVQVRYRKVTQAERYLLRHGKASIGEFVDLSNLKRVLSSTEARTLIDEILSGPEIRDILASSDAAENSTNGNQEDPIPRDPQDEGDG